MPSTTVHIPDRLLAELDAVVKDKGISRNRFIVEACRNALENEAGRWPDDFFETDIEATDLNLMREGVDEMEHAIIKSRRNRKSISL
jgi:hypothetical protein